MLYTVSNSVFEKNNGGFIFFLPIHKILGERRQVTFDLWN